MKIIDRKQLKQEQFDQYSHDVQSLYMELRDHYDAERSKVNAQN